MTPLLRAILAASGLALAALRDVRATDRITVRRPVPDGYMIEHIAVHEAVVPDGVVPANRDGEVARFECLDTAALIEQLRQDAFTLEAALVLVGALAREGVLETRP